MLIKMLRGSPFLGGRQRFRPALVFSAVLTAALMALTLAPQTAFAGGGGGGGINKQGGQGKNANAANVANAALAKPLNGTLSAQIANVIGAGNVDYADGGDVGIAACSTSTILCNQHTATACAHVSNNQAAINQVSAAYLTYFDQHPELAGTAIPLQNAAKAVQKQGNSRKQRKGGGGGGGDKKANQGGGGGGHKNNKQANADDNQGGDAANALGALGLNAANVSGNPTTVVGRTNSVGFVFKGMQACEQEMADSCAAKAAPAAPAAPTNVVGQIPTTATQPIAPRLTTAASPLLTASSPAAPSKAPTQQSVLPTAAQQPATAATAGQATYASVVPSVTSSAIPTGYQLAASTLAAPTQLNSGTTLAAAPTLGVQAAPAASSLPAPLVNLYKTQCGVEMVKTAAFEPNVPSEVVTALTESGLAVCGGNAMPTAQAQSCPGPINGGLGISDASNGVTNTAANVKANGGTRKKNRGGGGGGGDDGNNDNNDNQGGGGGS
ncbi:MAG: hypothetical protein ACREN8_07400 [Candidatus Dormibacteraceae bacterium]